MYTFIKVDVSSVDRSTTAFGVTMIRGVISRATIY